MIIKCSWFRQSPSWPSGSPRPIPGFDVVVATSQYDDVSSREPEMLNDGKTTLVTVGKKGKHVGLDRPLSPGRAARAVSHA